jgi:uncharacterized protein YbaR (Trm112 family)
MILNIKNKKLMSDKLKVIKNNKYHHMFQYSRGTMDIKLMEILCCPVCKSDLKLDVVKQKNDEILQGSLYCEPCRFSYPIDEGIPNLLPPEYHEKNDK